MKRSYHEFVLSMTLICIAIAWLMMSLLPV